MSESQVVQERSAAHRMIRASAGAGKTYRLTSRYLALLARGAPAETILATTFTRKAAGEIRGRVLCRLAIAIADSRACEELSAALAEELGVTVGASECTAILRGLVDALPRMEIATIDSFFHRLATCFRLELQLPAEPQLVDDKHPVAAGLRAEALEAMLDEHVHELDELVELVRDVQGGRATRSVLQALDDRLCELYEVYRQAPQREVWMRLQGGQGRLDEAGLARALQALREMEPELPRTKKGEPDQRWKTAWSASIESAEQEDWDSFASKGVPGKLLDGELTFYSAPITQAWQDTYAPFIGHVEWTVRERLTRRAQAIHTLTARFDAHYTRLRQRDGVLLYSDLAYKLAEHMPRLSGELAEIYYRLNGAVEHLLLDEFQDTSLVQWSVLEPFTRAIIAPPGTPTPAARSFFCVGDTKQAIYGWRGGCVELFDVVETELRKHDGATESLSTSRRCAQVVLDAVNGVFAKLTSCTALTADMANAWQRRFDPHQAHHQARPGHVRLMTTPVADQDDASPDPDAADADDQATPVTATSHEAFVAGQVAELHSAAPGATIGVLVRTNRAGRRLLYELRRCGLPVSGEGGNPVTDAPAVAAVLSALLLADHPGHTAAGFHVMSSPLGGVVGLRSMEAKDCNAAALHIRQRLITEGYAAVLADWTHQLAGRCDHRDLMRLMQLVELAEQHGRDATLRPTRFVAAVEHARVEEPMPAAIRVMTIHAAKGLEFDAVVLPDLDGTFVDRWTVITEREHPTGPITGVYGGTNGTVRRLVPELAKVHAQQLALQRAEDLCTLYVAMTRAKHALHLFVRPRKQKTGGKLASPGASFGSILRDTLSNGNEHSGGEQVLYECGHTDWTLGFAAAEPNEPARPATGKPPIPVVLAASGQPRRGWLAVSPSSLENDSRLSGTDLLALDPGGARQRGILMHAWLEHIGHLDASNAVPGEAELREIAARVMPGNEDAWLAEQLAAFERMLAQPAVRAALSPSGASEVWRERRFAVRDGTRLLSGQLDRVTIWRDTTGRATAAELIDFKTDQVTHAGLDAAVRRYRPQTHAYRRALVQLLSLDEARVTSKLLFLHLGELVSS